MAAPHDIVIRRATPSDAGAIAAIYNHYVLGSTATFDTQPKSVVDRRRWLSGRDPRHPVLVAESGGRVLGWAALSRFRERPAWVNTAEVAVYVEASNRGSGIGGLLLARLVEEAEALGLHALVSQVVGGNEASVGMAERLGFEQIGVLKEVGRKFGTWLDVVIMERILPAGGEKTADASVE